jgi:hypothetical protein
LQNNNPESLRNVYARTGILWQPREIGISKSEFNKIMLSLNWYQKNFGRRYTVLNEERIDNVFIQKIVEKLEF